MNTRAVRDDNDEFGVRECGAAAVRRSSQRGGTTAMGTSRRTSDLFLRAVEQTRRRRAKDLREAKATHGRYWTRGHLDAAAGSFIEDESMQAALLGYATRQLPKGASV